MIGKEIDDYIKQRVDAFLNKEEEMPEHSYDSVFTDTFSELIDKLIIVHIRYWNIEDDMAQSHSDEELAALRRKSEPLFKQKRPMLVTALDKMILNLLEGSVQYETTNLKKYKGWEK